MRVTWNSKSSASDMASASCFPLGELLHAAVTLVLKDDGFSIPSQPAQKARVLAEKYLERCKKDENRPVFQLFSQEPVKELEGCFVSQRSVKVRWERMWESYYKLHSSTQFSDARVG